MADALSNLCGPGKPLRAEAPDPQEIDGLIRTGAARLGDAANPALAIRNLGEYEGLLDADERLVADLIHAARKVADRL